ncbi:hypothetical protein [Streptomyces sp. NBC_00483]|uniref:hypothetical protein n=1 Tax=Streptomyces sp. NBC_00483 TaxID=2975756 RepID=UPI002E1932E2
MVTLHLPHLIHRDPHWQVMGAYAYYRCRCGAKRTRRLAVHMFGPIAIGWPTPQDRHGRPVAVSRWQRSM